MYRRPSAWVMRKILGKKNPAVAEYYKQKKLIEEQNQARKEEKKKTRYNSNNIILIKEVLRKGIPATETSEKTTALISALSVQQPKEREIVSDTTKEGIDKILRQGLEQGMDEEKQLKNLSKLIKQDTQLNKLIKANPNADISKIIARAILSDPNHPFFNNVAKANVSNVPQ